MREKVKLRLKRRLLGWMGFFVLQLISISCNFSVPSGGENFALLNNFRKIILNSSISEANITVSGTLKDSAGNILSGGILDIARAGSSNVLERAPADTKVYADINGKFSMNIYVGSFSIRVSRSDGTFVGSFDLKVNNATDVPQVSSSLGLQVTGIAATPVGSGTSVSSAPVITISNSSSSILEGSTKTIGVRLTGNVTQSLVLNLSSNNPTSLTISPGTLTFNSSNFSIDQQVTLTALQDSNLISEDVTISIIGTGLTTVNLPIKIIDSDTQNIVISGINSLIEGESGNISFNLTKKPSSNVTLNISSSLPASLSLGVSNLTFTPNNFNIPQSIIVTSLQDDLQISDTVTISAISEGISTATWNITCIDNLSILLSGATSVREGQTAIISVSLSQKPVGNMLLNISSGNPAIIHNPSSLTFTTENYSTAQNIVLTGVEDINEISETVTLSVSSLGYTTVTKIVTCIDNDIKPVFAGASSVNEGANANLSVSLSGNPGMERTINLSSNNTSALTLSPPSLTFTDSNWNNSQIVVLTGVQDTNTIGESVIVTASGTDVLTSTKTINIIDDDTLSLIVSTSSNTIAEGTSTTSISVRLSHSPSDSFLVSLNSSNTGSVTISPNSLTFNGNNYTTPQSAILTGVEDSNSTSETITVTISGTGVTTQTLTYTTLENDTTIVFGSQSGSEGNNLTIPITLTGNPGSTRTLNFNSNNNPPVISPPTMTFTPSNFNTPQILTLTGLTDSNTSTIITGSDSDQSSLSKIKTNTWDASNKKYSISGTITGLSGNLILNNKNNYDTLILSSNSSFTFPKTASSYAITAKLYLLGKICTLTNTSGIASTLVTNIGISCTSKTFTAGDASSGLINTGYTISKINGDDAYYKYTLIKSFLDNGDGTILDNNTGITYQKCSSGQNNDTSCTGDAIKYSWSEANTYCSALGLSGKTWRLPTVNELANLIDYGKSSGLSIDTVNFPNTKPGIYWTSIQYQSSYSLGILFSDGSIGTSNDNQLAKNYVRCVSGQSTNTSYTDQGNGTIKSNSTGLIWQKCSAGQSGSNCSTGSAGYLHTWLSAISYCEALSLGGRTDWRLPNINELRSIIDYNSSYSWRISSNFPYSEQLYYSSTPLSTDGAWLIDINWGQISPTNIGNSYSVRCITGP